MPNEDPGSTCNMTGNVIFAFNCKWSQPTRSLNGREFPQSILKFLTATEEEAKQYLMDCIDNDIKENMNLNEIANNLNIFNVKENSFCMLKNDSDYLSQDVLTSGVRRIADRNH